MNYLFNDRNLLRSAILSALNIVASTSIFRTDNDAKAGSGVVTLSGPYTGQHDTVIEIEILDGTGDSSQVSQPVFRGVGNGTISDISVTALAAQDFSVVVQDLGTQTVKAIAPFQGATLRALAAGPQGNLIAISVDPSAIVRTPIDRALQDTITAGTNTYTGTQWDFGALALDAAGNIPDDAPRISFGDDPQVYLAFKSYDYQAQQWVFGFSPPPVRDVQQGAVVKEVTGTWGVTLSDGTTTETYTGIVTLRDALDAIQSAPSALCEVITPITNNHQPGGMAAMDLSVWTQPLVLSITEDGSFAVKQAVIDFTADSTAPTETVQIRCTSAATIGAEIWSVSGDITQGLPDAVTGLAYDEGPYAFTIPVQRPTGTPPNGNLTVDWNPGPRSEETPIPTLCLDLAQLGALAQNRSYTFTLKKKPAADCDCNDDHPTGGPRFECLGIEPEGGDAVASDRAIYRQQQLAARVRYLVQTNTTGIAAASNTNFEGVDPFGIDIVLTSAGLVQSCLAQIEGGTLDYPVWLASHDYGIDTVVTSVNKNGYRFIATTKGTSASSEPTWPTTIGGTVVDGGVTWKNIGLMPFETYDAFFTQWASEIGTIAGVLIPPVFKTWAASTQMQLGDVIVPATRNGHSYALARVGTTAASAPTFPTDGTSVTDGTAIWVDMGPYWLPDWPYTTLDLVFPGNGLAYQAATGVSDSTEPDWSTATGDGDTLVDGAVTWTAKKKYVINGDASDEFYQRYKTMAAEVLAAAGITSTFSSASTNGDGCWRDYDDSDKWWVNTDGPLLPFQTGHGYHSAREQLDPATGKLVPMTTEEFFIRLKFGCVDGLAIGDSFTVNVSGVSGGGGTYQEGDTITVVVAHQDPVPFGGGQLGNDMITFGVRGTADGDFPPYHLIAASPAARINSHSYLLGDLYAPATPNGHFYECTQAGTSAASAPTFTTDRSEFADGTAMFQDMGMIDGYDEGGLAMTIVQGGIPFALADEFDFSAIGGHFQWRQDGGSWNGPVVIGTTALADGISADFAGGASPPSWAAGDIWTFLAQAVNGPDQIMAPTDGRLSWTTSTMIGVTPADNGPASRVAIFDHHIPDTANIVLEGSDDDFATTPTSVTIEWQERNLFATFDPVTRAKWRITVDTAGDCFWVFLGEQMQPMLRDPGSGDLKPDYGHFTRRRRAAGLGVRAGVGGDILHDVVCAESLDDFEAGFDYACANDNRAFGIVINDDAGELALVRFTGTEIETKDVLFDYQASRLDRYQSFTFPTEALP